MPTTQTLSDFLADLFTTHELLDWIRRLPGGAALRASLFERDPIAKVASDAEALLGRHGMVDAALFDALLAVRPKRAAEIVETRARMLAPVAPKPPTPIPNGPAAPKAGEDPRVADLRALIAARHVVVIVGAGVTMAATGGSPTASWKGLLLDGVGYCVTWKHADAKWGERQRGILAEGDTDEWINVARLITQKLGGARGGDFRAWLRKAVGELQVKDRTLIDALAALGCPIATTNYNDLIERTLGWKTISWDEDHKVDRWLRGAEPAVLHLHGHWERSESVVLGVESYRTVRDAPHARAVREALRATKSLLFIGCGDTTADPNIGAWLRWSGEVFVGGEYRNYRLERDERVSAVQALHPAAQRLFVIGTGSAHGDLPGFLRRLAPRDDGSEAP